MSDESTPKRPDLPLWDEGIDPSDWANKLEDVVVDAVAYMDAIERERDELRERLARVTKALHRDTPFPADYVIERLCDAVEHLQHDHNCDVQGYEEWDMAARYGREIVVDLHEALATAQSLLQNDAPVEQVCEWREDDEGTWHASCGTEWQFTNDGPVENDVHYCMGCGKPIKLVAGEKQ